MRLKSLYGRIGFEAQIHSHHSECKNEQKSMLTNVNRERNALPHFQMFAFSFFDGSFIGRFLPILRPPSVPRRNICPSKFYIIC